MRRSILGILSTAFITAGVLCIADAALAVAWQEPLSAIQARIEQDRLGGRLDRAESGGLLLPAQQRRLRRLPSARRIPFLARALRRRIKTGDPLGRIRIPKIGAKYVVVQGTDTASLEKGPGHYPETSLPGLPGTTAIAGHRTTYLAPFRHVNDLHHGDAVILDLPYGRFTYRVQYVKIVPATATYVTRSVGYPRLVLSACHPLYSASHRIIVFARLESAVPA